MLSKNSIAFLKDVRNELSIGRKFDTTDCYYHYFGENMNVLDKILESNAILCKNKIHPPLNILDSIVPNDRNGFFYISVTKKNVPGKGDSAYDTFIKNNASLIINPDIKTIETKQLDSYEFGVVRQLMSRFGLMSRTSEFYDEFQVKNMIALKDVIGIQYRLYGCLDDFEQNKYWWLNGLYTLGSIANMLDQHNIDLPIIDEKENVEIRRSLIYKYYRPNRSNYSIHDYFNQ